MERMNEIELMAAIDEFWEGNQTLASKALGLSSPRRMREYLSGQIRVPRRVQNQIEQLRAEKSGGQTVQVALGPQEMEGMLRNLILTEVVPAIAKAFAEAIAPVVQALAENKSGIIRGAAYNEDNAVTDDGHGW